SHRGGGQVAGAGWAHFWTNSCSPGSLSERASKAAALPPGQSVARSKRLHPANKAEKTTNAQIASDCLNEFRRGHLYETSMPNPVKCNLGYPNHQGRGQGRSAALEWASFH